MTNEEFQEQLDLQQQEIDQLRIEREEFEEKIKNQDQQLSDVGGVEGARQVLDTLSADDKFAEYVKNRNDIVSSNNSNATNQNVEIVRNIAAQAVSDKLSPVEEQLASLQTKEAFEHLSEVFPGWEQYEDKIVELSKEFPFVNPSSPNQKELEVLALMAGRAVDGDAAVELLSNEPAPEQVVEAEIPKNMSTLDVVSMAADRHGLTF